MPSFVLKRVLAYEFDLAGVVVDPNGTDFEEGDEIFGVIPVRESTSLLSTPMSLPEHANSPSTELYTTPPPP